MANHDVKFSVPLSTLGKADIELIIRKDDKKFGTLRISKGAIVWLPNKGRKGGKIAWTKFDKIMQGQTAVENR